ncbi:hypothetical protein GQR58_026194 [Nymphon striatum]|nr:hypothetical protein GQR58_026194 [Nymphon striatum]
MESNGRQRKKYRRYLTDTDNINIPPRTRTRTRWRETEDNNDNSDNSRKYRRRYLSEPDILIPKRTRSRWQETEDSDENADTNGIAQLENTETSADECEISATPNNEFELYNSEDFWSDNRNTLPCNQEESENAHYFQDNIPNIPNGDEFIYGRSDITKGQAIVTIISFILRHHLTDVAVQDLLEMFNILAPGCLPPSKFLLTKGFGSNFDAHLFCPVCEIYLNKFSDSENMECCNSCNTKLDREQCLKDGNFYLYIPIEDQLKKLLKKHSLVKKSDFVDQDDLVCAFSGRIIKEHFNKGEITDDDLTLLWNCDGAPVFKSSKRSVWPLQACVNEISSNAYDNCLLIGLWFAKEKPWSDCYLKPFVDEMKRLGTTGMDWLNKNNEIVHSRVFTLCSSCDSCARPMFRHTMQFNGRFGCDWCLQEGEVIERGDGFSRIYTVLENPPEKREHVKFMEDALASSNTSPVNGVNGISPLLFLPLFNIVRGFVPDYLHCVLLGVVRMFSGLWFDSRNHEQTWYIGRSLSVINHKLCKIKIPSSISRLPRSLSERKFWKGSEWKSFLLYYSLIVLQGTLPQQYFNHWFLLVFSINLLLQDKINPIDVDLAEKTLMRFVQNVPVLYGREYCTFNVHQLLHITDAVRDWGPLWVFSCFRFESNIGQMTSLVRGTKCVPMQICNAFLMHMMLPNLHHKYFTDSDMRLNSLINRLMCSGRYVRKKSTSVDNVHLYGTPTSRLLETAEIAAFDRLFGTDPNTCSYRIYNRLAINSLYICSIDHKSSNRNCDDTVELQNGFCVLLRCAVGKFFCNCCDPCNCEETVLLFVNRVDILNDRHMCYNRDLNASSNRFLISGQRNHETICCKPGDVIRKCFRHKKNENFLIIPLPTVNEFDK